MRQIIIILFTLSACVFSFAKSKSATLDINLSEEKNPFDHLKVKFISFSHEHSSPSPDQPFAATTGLYTLKITEGSSFTETTIYTNTDGLSKPVTIWNKFEFQILKDTDDQKTITLEVKKLK